MDTDWYESCYGWKCWSVAMGL